MVVYNNIPKDTCYKSVEFQENKLRDAMYVPEAETIAFGELCRVMSRNMRL
jgi:hypothetical protein